MQNQNRASLPKLYLVSLGLKEIPKKPMWFGMTDMFLVSQ